MDDFRFADQYILNKETYLNICRRIDEANILINILSKKCDISIHAESPSECYIRINGNDKKITREEYVILREWLK